MEPPKDTQTEPKKDEVSEKTVPADPALESEEEKKKLHEASVDLFTNYIQCFKNKTPEQIKQDKKFKELYKDHKFWDTQPVPKPTELAVEKKGAFEQKTLDEVSKVPVKLPSGFVWEDFDLSNDAHMKELYTLLAENYVEDDDGCFRFDYSIDFLRWALMPPGFHKDLYFGIRCEKQNNILVGFISGIPVDLKVENSLIKTTEVNFLCVHKKFRHFSMASVLIKEVVRRSNLKKVWQGVFTSGTFLPTPFAQTRYYHRSLNPRKLIEARFSYANPKFSLATYEKLNQVPETPNLPEGHFLRKTEERDIKQLQKLIQNYIKQFTIFQEYTKEETKHWFIHRSDIIESYVVEKNGKISDFFCFYSLPSSILRNEKYKTLRAAYAYYFVPGSMSLRDLFECALIKAKESGYDVFNALDVMNNTDVFESLNFHGGDGYLNYYLYNWKLEKTLLEPAKIGFVLM